MGNGDESNRHSNALDLDMDLDELAPARKASRFQHKFKPKVKSKAKEEGEAEQLPPTSNPVLRKEEEEEGKKKGSINILKQVKSEKSEAVDEKPVVVAIDALQDSKGEKIEKVDPVTEAPVKDEVGEESMDVDAGFDMDGDEEDAVVREIDVFFSPLPDENTQLYVMQYPLRPCWRPYEFTDRCQEIRVEPKESKLEIDLEINIGTDNSRGDEDVPKQLRQQKQTLTSSKVPTLTSYAVGTLMGNKLHLNPINAVVQFRPSMAHLNAGKIKKSEAIGNSQVATKPAQVIKEEATKPLNLPGKLATEASSEQVESWVNLEYHDVESPISSKYRQRIALGESSNLQFSMNLSNYVNCLCPGTLNNGTSARGPSLLRSLLKLPFEERFKKWFSEGPHIHRYAAVLHLAPECSVENVLKALQQFAVLVKGLWVSKTSLRCEGVQALARDYILLLFTKNQFVHRDQLTVLKVPNEIMKNILCSLAVERTTFRDWKFKESEDVSFIKAHPDIVEAQKLAWSHREKYITEAVYGAGRKGMAAAPKNPLNPSIGDKGAASSNQRVTGGIDGNLSSRRATIPSEIRAALPKALMEVFHLQKVCSLQLISQSLKDMAIAKSTNPKADPKVAAAAARGASAPLSELQSVLSEVAVNIHGVYVLKSLGNAKLDPLRTVVINLLMAKKPNEKLVKAEILEAAKIALRREVITAEYQVVMSELCTRSGNGWMLKSGDGRSK